MIVFRNHDPRFPFLWEGDDQPAARWHDARQEPVQYFADTADGAWAEFVRHEELTDIDDLAGVRRGIAAVDIDARECVEVDLPDAVSTGRQSSYAVCRVEAHRIRATGATGLVAPSAALQPGAAGGLRVDDGLRPAPPRDGRVYVLFGRRPDLIGWQVSLDARPPARILRQVRHF